MEITNITITNIKRYGVTDNSLNVILKSNKYNLLIAPNGFGKSSLAKAFEMIRPEGIKLKKELYYEGNETLNPKIEITINNQIYSADKMHNCISPVIEPYVINSGLFAKGSAQRFGRVYNPKGIMQIENVVIKRLIPEKSNFHYSYNTEKKNFGLNGKVLSSLQNLFLDKHFCADLKMIYTSLDKYTSQLCNQRENLLKEAKTRIQNFHGSVDQVRKSIQPSSFEIMENEENYNIVSSMLIKHGLNTPLDRFLAFYQLRDLYISQKTEFKKMCDRAEYELEKANLQSTLDSLVTPQYPIKLVENKYRSLQVVFPDAENISNGQRDLISFVANIWRFRFLMKSGKQYLLFIDEIFDYLDDANFIAAQFYLSNILKAHKNIIIVILTHLDPRYFRMSTVFSSKKMNVQFMMNVPDFRVNTLKHLVVFRQKLDHNSNLYRDISTYLFHYSPTNFNVDYKKVNGDNAVLDNFSSTDKLKKYVAAEITNYLQQKQQFDPIAICLGIRYKSEKDMYVKLDESHQRDFLIQKGTRNRLEFAENILGSIDDKYYILSVLHNDINHLADINEEKVCIYQLENLTIRHMIYSLFCKRDIQIQDL